ncbi:MAG: hypothetical protein GVY14_07640, partial [Spirochaetes bacterium]|nr:hypothetical protein [Spirochaetota bacterium]
WNRGWPDAATARRIITRFRRAVTRADMLGIVPDARILRIYQTYGRLAPSNRGLVRVLDHVASHPPAATRIISAQVQRDLADWGLWPDILAAVPGRRVSWIAPHDLAPFLHARFGLETRQGLRIPGEAKYTGMFDPATARPGALLDCHDAVDDSLETRPGETWLVAAGFRSSRGAAVGKRRLPLRRFGATPQRLRDRSRVDGPNRAAKGRAAHTL